MNKTSRFESFKLIYLLNGIIRCSIYTTYWDERQWFFTRFDYGVRLDYVSFYSVTPETIAAHVAERCRCDGMILDLFSGCGGNCIQFAKTCERVFGVEIDKTKLNFAQNNAKLYYVEDRIEYLQADVSYILKDRQLMS